MQTKFKKLTPDLMVDNVADSVVFYVTKLGFELDMVVPENEESIETELISNKKYVYAMIHKDEVFIMFMQKDVYIQELPALKKYPIGASASLYIDVENLEKFYNKIKNKVEVIKEFFTTWYGMNEFYIKDNNGYILGFAERKK
jgi:uncharacterized glyoxalase superfamily protein PhnB